MYMKSVPVAAAALAALTAPASADERAISFPETADGGVILTADLHTHTVFSDGQVWPTIRVEEAHRDGLDLLAMTEHLEGQPKRDDIPHPDRNRSYEVAVESLVRAGYQGLLIINGAEITRAQPNGHINAVFLEDANKLLVDDPRASVEAASAQGAFVFLNHPHWEPQAPDGIAKLTPYHEQLIEDGLLHGVEVANGTMDGHSEHALQFALDKGLTVLGTSDIHGLVDWTHNAGHGGHRPMTLVLASDRSLESMKTALFDGRTVAWNYDDLMGKAEHVRAVVGACLSLAPEPFNGRSTVLTVSIRNACPVNFTLQNTSEATFQNRSDVITVPRNDAFPVRVRLGQEVEEITLTFTVLNTQIGFREALSTTLNAAVPARVLE
ncbi:MAG: Sb-PDE family phosphodiesterase [Pseudomonadota bacterium]